MDQKHLNWWSIVTKPGQSASYVFQKKTTKRMIWVLVFTSIIYALIRLGIEWPTSILDGVISGLGYALILLLQLIGFVFLFSLIIKYLGVMIGGKGTWLNIVRSLIWSFVPYLMMIIIPSLLVFFRLILIRTTSISISHSVLSGFTVFWNWCHGIAIIIKIIYQIIFVAVAHDFSWLKSFFVHILFLIVFAGGLFIIAIIIGSIPSLLL